MQDTINLGIIVSNVMSENKFSHCRLCLKIITENYVSFNDAVSLYPTSGIFQPLSSILTKLFGENICEEVTGVEAVCTDCVDKALTSLRLIETCQRSTFLLNQVFANLSRSLDVDINTENDSKNLYILVEDEDAQILLVDKAPEKEKSSSNTSMYFCLNCNTDLETFADLKAHNLAFHGKLTCEKCFESFLNESELAVHENKGHRYKCPDCPQVKTDMQRLRDHQTKHHLIFVCKECGKSCQGLDKLYAHEDKHKAKKSSCPKCFKSYTTREFYEKHVKLCLNNLIDPHPIRSSMEKSYVCEKCDKAYSTPGGLRVHNRFVHGNAKPHVCKECGKKFTAPSYLKVHMIKHTGEKNFKCDICNSRFVSKEALLYHTRRHTGEKPYSCKYCSERFVNASSRAEHIKFKHVGPTLMCEICSRKFVTANFLKQHISRHHDPTSKLYYGRDMIPPNLPVEQNMRRFIIKTEE